LRASALDTDTKGTLMTSRRAFLRFAIAAIIAAAAEPAFARRRFRGRGIGRGSSYAGPVMSRDELRFCVTQEARMENLEQAISEQERAAAIERLQLEESERALANAKTGVDVYSQSSVDKFNEMVERHGDLVDQYNGRLPLANQKITARNEAVDIYNAACADKAYFEDDLAIINAEGR
jgi:uncharacterized protein (DUF924 family)